MATERSVTSSTATRSRPSSAASAQPPQAVQQVSDTARQTMTQATQTAKQQANRQLDNVSDGLEQVAQTLHQAGDSLRENNQGAIATYVDKAAGQIERASTYVRVRSVDDIVEDVQSYARREPMMTIGVALGVGFLAARLLKASMGRATGQGTNDARYRTRAYFADRTDPMTRDPYAAGGTSVNRYGDGA